MGRDDETIDILYLTTRDINSPRTGGNNRGKYIHYGLTEEFFVDAVFSAIVVLIRQSSTLSYIL